MYIYSVGCVRVRQLRRTELAGELKAPNASALPTRSQCTPKSNAFSGTPPKLVGALIKGKKPYTKGIAKLYEWQGKLGGKSPSTRPVAEDGETRMTFGVMDNNLNNIIQQLKQ